MKYSFDKKTTLLQAILLFCSIEYAIAQESNVEAQTGDADAETSGSFWQTMKSSAENMSGDLEKKASEGLEYTKQKMGEYREFKEEKAKEVLGIIDDNMKVIEDAGFKVNDLYVSLSVVPVVTAKFKQVKRLSDEELNKLLENYQDKPLLVYILRSLHNAYGMNLSNYHVADVSVRASIPPATTVHLERTQ
ncbi:hypothetical protein [Zooshikella sp. RANM57]|uniref:hypothetical protein n=1 Tax=Zooshikella sp. RANM57 TaxID=3425863 RepID=UPI003D702294